MSHPLRYTDCGSDLEVRCPNGHDTLDEAIAAQCAPDVIAHSHAPRRDGVDRKKGTFTSRVYQPKPCKSCGATFKPTGPRALYCEGCNA